jgi:hypothetical protein
LIVTDPVSVVATAVANFREKLDPVLISVEVMALESNRIPVEISELVITAVLAVNTDAVVVVDAVDEPISILTACVGLYTNVVFWITLTPVIIKSLPRTPDKFTCLSVLRRPEISATKVKISVLGSLPLPFDTLDAIA